MDKFKGFSFLVVLGVLVTFVLLVLLGLGFVFFRQAASDKDTKKLEERISDLEDLEEPEEGDDNQSQDDVDMGTGGETPKPSSAKSISLQETLASASRSGWVKKINSAGSFSYELPERFAGATSATTYGCSTIVLDGGIAIRIGTDRLIEGSELDACYPSGFSLPCATDKQDPKSVGKYNWSMNNKSFTFEPKTILCNGEGNPGMKNEEAMSPMSMGNVNVFETKAGDKIGFLVLESEDNVEGLIRYKNFQTQLELIKQILSTVRSN